WYWETLRPSPSELVQANKFFKDANPTFLRSVNKFREWPQSDVPEVAFVGRSNVGKSSLLNAIVGADLKTKVSDKELARTSKHPGHTKMMNLYGVGGFDHGGGGVRIRPPRSGTHERIMGKGGLVIVDLPGYGEGSHQEWGLEILKYLTQRNQLQRTFILVDALAGLKDKDRSLLASLRLAGVSHQVILSKLDRVYIPDAGILSRVDGRRAPKPMGSLEDLAVVMQGIREEIQPRVGGGALGELLACSSEVRCNGRLMGMDAVRYAILQAASHQFDRVPEKKISQVKAVPPLIKKHAGLPPAKVRPLRTQKKSSPGSWKTARLH
ncbi:P-loop containing nucleoside triphosphate hydrolase protein, partial [Clohesyomyces aquaticus]